MRDPIAELVPAAEDGRTRRRTGRADMEVGKACALGLQLIKIGRLQKRMPVTGKIAITLVICHNQNNIGSLSV